MHVKDTHLIRSLSGAKFRHGGWATLLPHFVAATALA